MKDSYSHHLHAPTRLTRVARDAPSGFLQSNLLTDRETSDRLMRASEAKTFHSCYKPRVEERSGIKPPTIRRTAERLSNLTCARRVQLVKVGLGVVTTKSR